MPPKIFSVSVHALTRRITRMGFKLTGTRGKPRAGVPLGYKLDGKPVKPSLESFARKIGALTGREHLEKPARTR